MTRRMLPPVTVDTLTYAEDGSNRHQVLAFVGGYEMFSNEPGEIVCNVSARGPYVYVKPGQTVIHHPSGATTVVDPARVATWGVTVEQFGPRSMPVAERGHRFVTTFLDGSTHTTAWTEVDE